MALIRDPIYSFFQRALGANPVIALRVIVAIMIIAKIMSLCSTSNNGHNGFDIQCSFSR